MRPPESLAEQGTQVFSIHPGPISTDMGAAAGLTDIADIADIAEPRSLVGEALLAAMAKGEFHVFPDSMAKQISEGLRRFCRGGDRGGGGRGLRQGERQATAAAMTSPSPPGAEGR